MSPRARRFADPLEWEDDLKIRPSSPAWRAVTRAIYGTTHLCTHEELTLLEKLTNGAGAPEGGADDVLVVAGRRSGKSDWAARIAVFEAIHGGHGVALAPGQVALLGVTAPMREQAHETLGYVRGLARHPRIRPLVASDPDVGDGVEFKTGVEVKVRTFDNVGVRGPTWVGWVDEEDAFLPGEDSAIPASLTKAAIAAGLAPLIGAPPRRTLRITSANTTETLTYKIVEAHFGKRGAPIFVVSGSTLDFNPAIDRGWLEKRRAIDPRSYAREILSEWADAVTESWFGLDNIEGSIDEGRESSPYDPALSHVCAIDAAFVGDRFTCAVAHREKRAPRREGDPPREVIVVDYVGYIQSPRATLKLDAEHAVDWVVEKARSYGCTYVAGDQFGAAPLEALFRRRNIALLVRPWTAANKSPSYREMRAMMASGDLRNPDVADLRSELSHIAGYALPSGGERIEARRGHDDLVSAVMLAALESKRHPAGRRGDTFAHMTEREIGNAVRTAGRGLFPFSASSDADAEDGDHDPGHAWGGHRERIV